MSLISFVSGWLPAPRTRGNRRIVSHPISRSPRSLRLAVEQLECRELLSGLTAAIVGLPTSGQAPVGTPIHVAASVKGTTSGVAYTFSWQVVANSATYATGSTSTLAFTPDDHGTYTIDLNVTDKFGDIASADATLTVNAVPPTAHLASAFGGTARITLPFHATATDPSSVDTAAGFAYSWNFGDNTSGSGASPSHVYGKPGTYVATVTVTDENGEQGTAHTSVVVHAPPPPSVTITGVPTANRSPVATAITLGSSLTRTTANDTYTLAWLVRKNGVAFATATSSSVSFTPDDAGSYVAYLTVTDQFGTKTMVARGITVYDLAPTVQLAPSFNGAALSPLTFTASATDPSPADMAAGFRFLWYFGDGRSAWGATPAHVYAKPGTYSARVYAYDKHGLRGTATTQVTVIHAITASFSGPAAVTAGTTNAMITFANVGGGSSGGYTYSFDFGNTGTFEVTGSSTPSATVPESYVDDGPKNVVIRGRITDGNGNYRDFTDTVRVTHVAPSPKIVLPAPIEAHAALTFSDPATSPSHHETAMGFRYRWNFGDGTGWFTGESPKHTYAKPGKYTVTVQAIDSTNAVGAITTPITVLPAPSATFTGPPSVSEGTGNAQVTVSNPAGGSGSGYTYSFDFGNTGSFAIADSANPTATVPESYLDDPGTVVVRGRVTDGVGGFTDYTTTIAISDVAPTPAITAPSATDATMATAFQASATSPSTADTKAGFTYTWNFGDGTAKVTGANPTHKFATPGTYTVTLSAVDADGGTVAGTTSTTITVAALPTATFSGPSSVNEGTATATVTFASPTGGSGGYTYSYDFGNNGTFEVAGSGTATATIPESYVDDAGTLVVRGRITDSNGGYSDYTTTIAINDVAPTPSITGPSTVDAGMAVSFAGSATSPSTADTKAGFKYSWNFGDPTAAVSGANPTHTFANPGTYTVTLAATDADGGVSGSTTASISVDALPTATFSGPASVNEGTTTAKVTFASPTGGSGGYTYSYDFDNNGSFEIAGSSNSTATIPESYVDDAGTLTVRGRITDSAGGYTDYTTKITINDVAPTASIAAPTSSDVGQSVAFHGSATSPSTADTKTGFSYSWNFGDGSSAVTGAKPSHTYTKAGTYTVTLTATDADGGTPGSTTASITVNPLPTATFSGPSSVNEGTTTATVTFASPTGGSGGYTYSYDFGNNGTFEITGSATASATIPESYVDDAGTLTVRGRITDSAGGYTDYTTKITINDVAPTPTITPPASPAANLPATFSASATSPSAADTKAGFAYTWDFGDGTTGTGASVTHTYTLGGNYTVTLTAVDADGGTAKGTTTTTVTVSGSVFNSNPYITTPYLNIPNFGASPTIYSIASGNWSSPATWSLGRVPQAGDIVDINPGTTVTYDMDDSTDAVPLNTVEVQPTATLTFRTDISTQICVGNFMVLQGGSLIVGTAANPIAAAVHANIDIANQAINTTTDPSQFGTGLIVLGNVTMHGAAVTPYITLAQEAHKGDTVLHLATPATGWQPGDDIVIPDTRQLPGDGAAGYSYTPQWEGDPTGLTIASISADGLTVTLTSALKYNHLGSHDANGVLDYLPQVMDMTRNIMVESQSMTGTRGYTLSTANANVDIEYAGFCELGRTTNAAANNTTFNSNGSVSHVGTNEADRYAMTVLDLIGPASPQANGYQYTFIGNEVDNDGDGNTKNPSNIQWGLAVNNSYYGLIQDNDVWSVAGTGIGVEDNSSSYNTFDANMVANVVGTSSRYDQQMQGDAFWFGNPNNYITNNIATDINGGAWDTFSYGYDIDASTGASFGGVGTVAVAAYRGADPSQSGQAKQINMDDTPILQFSGNEVYGATLAGMTLWWIGTFGDTPYTDAQTSVVKDFVAWNFTTRGIYGYPTNDITIDGAVIRGDASQLTSQYEYVTGINFDDYMTHNLVIQNSDIQGMATGINVPFMVGRTTTMDTTTIQDCNLNNTVNIDISPARSVNGSSGLEPQTIDIASCFFAHPTTASQSWWYDVDMDYTTSDALGTSNMSIAQYVYVTNYNNIQGDNFEAFYTQSNSPTGTPPAGAKSLSFIQGLVLLD